MYFLLSYFCFFHLTQLKMGKEEEGQGVIEWHRQFNIYIYMLCLLFSAAKKTPTQNKPVKFMGVSLSELVFFKSGYIQLYKTDINWYRRPISRVCSSNLIWALFKYTFQQQNYKSRSKSFICLKVLSSLWWTLKKSISPKEFSPACGVRKRTMIVWEHYLLSFFSS